MYLLSLSAGPKPSKGALRIVSSCKNLVRVGKDMTLDVITEGAQTRVDRAPLRFIKGIVWPY